MSPGDPRECRLRAAECFRMAEQATSAQGRIEFNDFAKVWLRLATSSRRITPCSICGAAPRMGHMKLGRAAWLDLALNGGPRDEPHGAVLFV